MKHKHAVTSSPGAAHPPRFRRDFITFLDMGVAFAFFIALTTEVVRYATL
jgi:hypothetical protein